MCYLCSHGLGKLYSLVLATPQVIAAVFPAGKACSVGNKPCARHAWLQQSDLHRGNTEDWVLSTHCLQQACEPDASYLHECPSSTLPSFSSLVPCIITATQDSPLSLQLALKTRVARPISSKQMAQVPFQLRIIGGKEGKPNATSPFERSFTCTQSTPVAFPKSDHTIID